MFGLSGVEVVGYVASALVVVALTMTSVVRLRAVSLCGSIAFFVYAALIDSVPIMITNVAIAAINVWFLRKEFASGGPHGRDLGVSHIRPDSPFLADFVAFHLIDTPTPRLRSDCGGTAHPEHRANVVERRRG